MNRFRTARSLRAAGATAPETRKTLREKRKRFLRRHRQKLTAVGATFGVATIVAGLAVGLPAQAATGGTGWGTFGSSSTAYKGTFNANGTMAVCAEPGKRNPTGATTAIGQQGTAWLNANLTDFQGTHPNLTDNLVAGINRVLTEHAGTSDKNEAAALEYAIRSKMYSQDADLAWNNTHQGSMDAAINFDLFSTAGAGNVATIQQDAAALINEINSTVAGSGTNGYAGAPQTSLTLNSPTSATLTINFGGADVGSTWTDTLQNGVFQATGTDTMTGTVPSGQQVTLAIIPKLTKQGAKLTDSGSVTAPSGSSGYAPTLSVFTTPGQQTSVGAGGQAQGSSDTAQISDPIGLPTGFSPTVSTRSAAAHYVEGDTPTDTVQPTLGDTTPAGTSWPQDSNGNYVAVKIDATLYGPLPAKPVQGAAVPAGTPVAGHGTVTVGGGSTNPTTTTATITSDTKIGAAPGSSGYYVWVEDVAGSEQSAATQGWLTGGSSYAYTTDYGISDESFIAPPQMTTSVPAAPGGVTTSLNGKAVPTTGLGLPVTDTIHVTGNVDAASGLYVIDRHYTWATTVGPDGRVILPAPADQVTDATTLDYTSPQIPVTKAGDYTATFDSTKVGAGTWVETLYAPDNTVLATGSPSDTSEWTAVQQLVVTTTAATSGTGSAIDHTTVWGTALPGSQVSWALYDQAGATAADSDQLLGTAGPVGLPSGVLNGYQLTSPAVSFDAGDTKTKYFVESVTDAHGTVYEQGQRGVSSESLTPAGTHPKTAAVAWSLPRISG